MPRAFTILLLAVFSQFLFFNSPLAYGTDELEDAGLLLEDQLTSSEGAEKGEVLISPEEGFWPFRLLLEEALPQMRGEAIEVRPETSFSYNPDDLKPLTGTTWTFTYNILIDFTDTILFGTQIETTDDGVAVIALNQYGNWGILTYVYDLPSNAYISGDAYGVNIEGSNLINFYFFQVTGDTAKGFYRYKRKSDGTYSNTYSLSGTRVGGTSPPPCTGPLCDVPTNYWAYSYVKKLYDSGISTGCDAHNFCPENPVSRAEMAVFLERGLNGSNYTPAGCSGMFLDVPQGYWACDWIEALYKAGVTRGCYRMHYCPDGNVTRAEMAVFLLRTRYGANYNPPPATGIFTDVPTSHWVANWIEELYREGITQGCGNMCYCPENQVTRAEMAVFLVRIFGL